MNLRLSDKLDRKRAWKLVSTLVGLVTAMFAKRLIRLIYRSTTRNNAKDATPFDSSKRGFAWQDAVLWAAAAGVGLGVTQVVSRRIAAVGWEIATGSLPPGTEGEPALD